MSFSLRSLASSQLVATNYQPRPGVRPNHHRHLRGSQACSYNQIVARGWESKAVEAQVEAASEEPAEAKPRLSAEQLENRRRKSTLSLARAQVLQQLEASSNPRHRSMLESALADLDAELAELG
jgi:hypothetical protein